MLCDLRPSAPPYGKKPHIAICDALGELSSTELTALSRAVAAHLLERHETNDLGETRVAFLMQPRRFFVAALWGIWRAGGLAVPLCTSHPEAEWDYALKHTSAQTLLCDRFHFHQLQSVAQRHALRLICVEELLSATSVRDLPQIDENRRALLLFTSGTTKRPKGVVTTHAQLQAQVHTLLEAWHWSADDEILNVLPLHHTHGLINVVSCALAAGARLHMMDKFSAQTTWQFFRERRLSVFMAVPTIYNKLIQYYDQQDADTQKELSTACQRFRLMVSGSAALPVPTFQRWREISGQALLERYGMTEIGMALSNPYAAERRPGTVGQPLPAVQIQLVDENLAPARPGTAGEILVKGPGVFQEYWHNERATAAAFHKGWFRTGDIAQMERGYYKILGRNSIDIIKSGGYKISALEIENVLKAHPAIDDIAIIGVEDPEWGERLTAYAVALPTPLTLEELRAWARTQLAPYKLPTELILVEELPKNALGKVQKTRLQNKGKETHWPTVPSPTPSGDTP